MHTNNKKTILRYFNLTFRWLLRIRFLFQLLFRLLLTAFKLSNILSGWPCDGKNWLVPKSKPPNQVNLVQIHSVSLFQNIFWCELHHLAVFIIFCYFSAIKWSNSPSSFRWSLDLSPRLRTMAQIVSPWRSPLDQGASP